MDFKIKQTAFLFNYFVTSFAFMSNYRTMHAKAEVCLLDSLKILFLDSLKFLFYAYNCTVYKLWAILYANHMQIM